MPPEMLENLRPEFVVPIVAYLTSAENKDVNGEVFEMGAGFYAMLRRQRSHGHVFRTDQTFTPEAVREQLNTILDFDERPEYPKRITDANYLDLLERAKEAPANAQGDKKIDYQNQTVLVTGAGAGLGRAYAQLCLLYTSPSPRDLSTSRMPSSA